MMNPSSNIFVRVIPAKSAIQVAVVKAEFMAVLIKYPIKKLDGICIDQTAQ